MNRRTKIVLIVVGAIVLIGIGAVVVSLFSGNQDEASGADGGGFSFFGLSGDRAAPDGQDLLLPESLSDPDTTTIVDADTRARFREITSLTTAGAAFVSVAEDERIRFVERATGHIFETATNTDAVTRITNTTIPRIQESYWGADETVVLRYIRESSDIVESFVGHVVYPDPNATSTDTQEEDIDTSVAMLDGFFLPENTVALSFDPEGEQLFYLVESEVGATGFITDALINTAAAVFNAPTTEWLAEWSTDNTVTLTSKPHFTVSGHMFFLSLDDGSLVHGLGPRRGLTTLTGKGSLGNDNRIVYNSPSGSGIELRVFDTSDNSEQALSLGSLPEKCVWSAREQEASVLYCAIPNTTVPTLPNSWYEGEVAFADTLWKIETRDGIAERVFDPQSIARRTFDMTHLSLNEDETHILFTDKHDGSVWMYELVPPTPVVEEIQEESATSSEEETGTLPLAEEL